MPDLSHISVPCRCGAKILLGQAACPSCHAAVPPELLEALEGRLESSYADYREAKQQVGRASILLLVLGALHVALALFVLLLASDATRAVADQAPTALLPVVANGGIGVAFLGAWRAAKRAPAAAMTAALAIWAAVRLGLFLLSPAEFFLSFVSAGGIVTLMAKVAVLFVLVRGLLAGRWLRTLRVGIARDVARG